MEMGELILLLDLLLSPRYWLGSFPIADFFNQLLPSPWLLLLFKQGLKVIMNKIGFNICLIGESRLNILTMRTNCWLWS